MLKKIFILFPWFIFFSAVVFCQNNNEVTIWSGKFEHYNLQWTTKDFIVNLNNGKQKIFSRYINEDLLRIKTDIEKSSLTSCDFERQFTILSVVGPYVSYMDKRYWDCERTAHPGAELNYKTIDIRAVNSAKAINGVQLTDLFPENLILKAILADPLIKKTNISVTRLKDLPDLTFQNPIQLNNYENCSFYLSKDFLTQFAFHHIEKDKIAVRIALSPAQQLCRDALPQLGILLPIPPDLKNLLTLASMRKQGFLMKDSKQISKGKATSFIYENIRSGSHN